MVISMLQNLNDWYSSHYSIIKYVSFELIYYTINLSVILSYMVFSDLIYVFYITGLKQ